VALPRAHSPVACIRPNVGEVKVVREAGPGEDQRNRRSGCLDRKFGGPCRIDGSTRYLMEELSAGKFMVIPRELERSYPTQRSSIGPLGQFFLNFDITQRTFLNKKALPNRALHLARYGLCNAQSSYCRNSRSGTVRYLRHPVRSV